MKRSSHVRINITLPEETVALLDEIADKGMRSTFIDSAIREQIRQMKKEGLRTSLKLGAIARSERDRALVSEWDELEDDLWQD